MEKQYRAQREKLAAVPAPTRGPALAIEKVFKAIHEGRPDPELLAYQYVQALPKVAQSQGSTVWVIPSEVTTALRTLNGAFGNGHEDSGADQGPDVPSPEPRRLPAPSPEPDAGVPPKAA